MSGLIGKKIGMTSLYDNSGKNVACTVLEAGPCSVSQIKTNERDGYEAIQLAYVNKNEKKIILPLFLSSIGLFFLSLLFSYFFLIPAALGFFLKYNADVIEPLWSFNQYFNFIFLLFCTTGIAFQIPIFQIVIGLLGIKHQI
jgi:ribosomal protein L3